MVYLFLLLIPFCSVYSMEMQQIKGQDQKKIQEAKQEHMQQLHAQSSFIEAFLANNIRAQDSLLVFPDYNEEESIFPHTWQLSQAQATLQQLITVAKANTSPTLAFTTATNPRHICTLLQHCDEEDTAVIQKYRFCLHVHSYRLAQASLSLPNDASSVARYDEYKHLGATPEEIWHNLISYCRAIQLLKSGIKNADAQKINNAHAEGYIPVQAKTLQEFLNTMSKDLEASIAQEDAKKYAVIPKPISPRAYTDDLDRLLEESSHRKEPVSLPGQSQSCLLS